MPEKKKSGMTKIYPKMTKIHPKPKTMQIVRKPPFKKEEKVDKNKMGWVQDREKLRQTRRVPAGGGPTRLLPIPGTPAMTRNIKRSQMLKKRIKERKIAERLRKRNASRGGSRR
jgi:hypothetical protein